ARLGWRADLTTVDGLQSPLLMQVQATYEFLGPADHIRLTPSGVIDVEAGQVIQFSAAIVDAGNHPVSASMSWTTTDPTGSISNGGRYVAGSVTTGAPWYVNVTVAGSGKSASTLVNVRPASLAIGAVLYPTLLVAAYSGRVPRWSEKDLRRFMDDLERRFGKVFARWSGDPADLQGLKEFSDRFVSRLRYRPARGTGRKPS